MSSRAFRIALHAGVASLLIACIWVLLGDPLLRLALPPGDDAGQWLWGRLGIGLVACALALTATMYLLLREQPARTNARGRGRSASSIPLDRLQALAEFAPDVWWVVDVQTSRFVYVSPSVEQLRGYYANEVLLQDLDAALTRESHQHMMGVLPSRIDAFRRGDSASYTDELEQTCRNGGSVWTETETKFFVNEANKRLEMCGISRDRTAKQRDEVIRRESKTRLDLIHHCARLGYIDIDARTLEVFWSDETFRLLGYQPQAFTPSHRSFLERVHPDEQEAVQEDFSALLMEQTISDSEYRIVRPDGEILWVYGRGDLVRDERGRPLRYIIVLFDVTAGKRHDQQLKASVREKEVLLKEIHHRVKNNLQIISSLISLQASRVKDEESRMLFDESRSRIRALALVHERLYWSESLANIDFREYLRGVIQDLMHGRTNEQITITLDAEQIALDIDQAIPCGLIVNELCSNALKHAFVDRPAGAITVSLHRSGENMVYMAVRDDGVGLPAELDVYRETSIGMTLVTSLVDQIGGSLTVDRVGGTAFEITFRPQSHPVPEPSRTPV